MNRAERRKKAKSPSKLLTNLSMNASEREVHVKRMRMYRARATQALRDIEAGSITELDLAKFRNFVQIALALMSESHPRAIDEARMRAEILHLASGSYDEDEDLSDDHDVVWDPQKLQQTEGEAQ